MSFGPRNAGRAQSNGAHKLIVGVDFGTTYSGISYVSSNMSARDVNVINNWPGPGRFLDTNNKTPSRIAYANENAPARSNAIGFQVTPKMKSYAWFKLRLDRSATTIYDDPNLRQSEGDGVMKLPRGKNATQVCGEYMKELHDFMMTVLDGRFGTDVLRITPMEFWFTVPAIWSDAAKSNTLQAARIAGFGRRPGDQINLISEPEAASISALSRVTTGGSELQIAPGDGVLICDCGGGTVDITTYLIKSVQPELDFEELLVGEGGKCGSTYIDRLFLQWMTTTFGEAFTRIPFEKRGPGSKFMQEFEFCKRDFGFDGDTMEEHQAQLVMVGVEDSEHYDADEGIVKFTSDDLRSWFTPVVQKILALLGDQMRQSQVQSGHPINKILLVGGFGDSQYLLQSVRQWAAGHGGGVRVICPDEPQLAIVKGAAICGLGGLKVKSRRCRRHYGFQLDLPYDPNVDDSRHKYVDKFHGKTLARGTMVWKVKKGQKIDEDTFLCQPVSKPWYKHETLVFKLPLYACNADVPPRRSEHPRVHKIGEIVVDLSNVSLNKFKKKWKFREDKYIYNLQYEIQIMLGQREGVLTVKAKQGDEIVGQAYVEYDIE